MKKLSLIVAALLMVSAVHAISQGPGGRLYMTQLDTGTKRLIMRSLIIDENWDPVGTNYTLHTFVPDNNIDTNHRNAGISPEIMNPGENGANGYADLLFGVYYNNSPKSLMTGQETMDVVKVTPFDGGRTITVLGDGLASPTSGWYGGIPYACTDRGYVALPDPAGGFLNAGEVLLHSYDNKATIHVNSDSQADGDITDDTQGQRMDGVSSPDYLKYSSVAYGMGSTTDFEFLENKLYFNVSYWGPGEHVGIGYITRYGDGSMSTTYPGNPGATFVWRDSTMVMPDSLNGFQMDGTTGIAMFKVNIEGGQYAGEHVATYVTCGLRAWNQPGGTLTALALCVDLNDDGDAMDNDIGEITWVLRSDDAFCPLEPSNYYADMEVVTDPETGKKFLVVLYERGYSVWTTYNDSIGVYEMYDNGDLVGGTDGIKVVHYEGNTRTGTETGWPALGREIEFDVNPYEGGAIPEPTTLLLLGTGALGLVGYFRRRRLS